MHLPSTLSLLTLLAGLATAGVATSPAPPPILVPGAPPANASPPVLEAFVSFSIELAFFPDYAGNLSAPNTFSRNLLDNIGNITGTKPYVRVGGNTQDYALYNASLPVATNGTYTPASADYPTKLTIGPSFFESYATWPGVRFTHGFNLAANGSAGRASLLATVPLACAALSGGRFLAWELGNEPDLYSTSAQGAVRPPGWDEEEYVGEWVNGTRAIREVVAGACPAEVGSYGYYAPSFSGTDGVLNPVVTWRDGLDVDGDVVVISSHNYIGGATQPGVTLQGTLMNHSSTVASIAPQLNESRLLAGYNLPYVLGETNSLYNEGAPGLSNAFGAALWGLDFNLWCAAHGIGRTHMHQGSGYRYAAWQPVETNTTTMGTKPPYYGNVAVAAVIGNVSAGSVVVVNLPLPSVFEAAYAAYVAGALARLVVVNMREFNYTGNNGSVLRGVETYRFRVPDVFEGRSVGVKRLMANGSDALSGVTFDGFSYNYELDEGRPVRLGNVTRGETVVVGGEGRGKGVLEVTVPDSSAVVVELGCE